MNIFSWLRRATKVEPKVEPKVSSTDDYILRSPWKADITIERSSWKGSGDYGSIKGQAYHSVSCAADGPNNDAGKTMHHGWIGYWMDFGSFEEANAFAVELHSRIKELVGVDAPIYASDKDLNNQARWCLGEIKRRPKGIRPEDLPTTFKGYE